MISDITTDPSGRMWYKGIEVLDRDLPQLMIVRGKSKTGHFAYPAAVRKVSIPGTLLPITTLCCNSLRNWRKTGTFIEEYERQRFDIHHNASFCQGCKDNLAKLLGVKRLTDVVTGVLPEVVFGRYSVGERSVVAIRTRDTDAGEARRH